MYSECPKCGYAIQDTDPSKVDSCPRCGIIFSKYSAGGPPRPAQAPARAQQPVPTARHVPWIPVIVGAAVVGLALLIIMAPRGKGRKAAQPGFDPDDLPYDVRGTFAGGFTRTDPNGVQNSYSVEFHVNDRLVVDKAKWTIACEYREERWVSFSGTTDVDFHVDPREYWDGSRRETFDRRVELKRRGTQLWLDMQNGVSVKQVTRLRCQFAYPATTAPDAGEYEALLRKAKGEDCILARMKAAIPPIPETAVPAADLDLQFSLPALWSAYQKQQEGALIKDPLANIPGAQFAGFDVGAYSVDPAPLPSSLRVKVCNVRVVPPDGLVEERAETRYTISMESPTEWVAEVKFYKDGRKIVQPEGLDFTYDVERTGP
ncbi:MAG: hypothetical protein AB1714_16850 [Acidobacteriota bacterium]